MSRLPNSEATISALLPGGVGISIGSSQSSHAVNGVSFARKLIQTQYPYIGTAARFVFFLEHGGFGFVVVVIVIVLVLWVLSCGCILAVVESIVSLSLN
jgi:hypothetical protein